MTFKIELLIKIIIRSINSNDQPKIGLEPITITYKVIVLPIKLFRLLLIGDYFIIGQV